MRPVVAGGTGVSTVGAAQTAFKIPPFDGTATISGVWTYTAAPKFNDGVAVTWGTDSDATAQWANATSVLLFSVTGSENHRVSSSFSIRNSGATEILALFTVDGSVDLYYDGSKTFETKSGGVTITGDLEADTFSGAALSNDRATDTGATDKALSVAEVEALVNGFTSTEQTITSAALLTLPHGLGAAPSRVSMQLSCQTGEHNWVAGDKPFVTGAQSSGATARHNSVWADATNVYVRFSDIATCFAIGNKTTGAAVNLTNANWKLIVRAGL